MKSKAEQAVGYFNGGSGFSCSQAVFAAYCEDFGLDRETALKLSCGLGGGMGRLGYVCGAMTGAILVLGLKYGRSALADSEAKEKTYALVLEFERRFSERNRAVNCRDLLGLDMRVAEKSQITEAHSRVCPGLVRSAVEILEELLRA